VAVGLFIDGQALAGSGNHSLNSNGATRPMNLFGATNGLIAAGKDKLSLKFDCVTSSFNTGTVSDDGAVGVIALGHQPGTFEPTAPKQQSERKTISGARALGIGRSPAHRLAGGAAARGYPYQ
jgi:hypothetical protein